MRKRVLVIDKVRDNIKQIVQMLQEDYEVLEAVSEQEAKEVFCQMPGVDMVLLVAAHKSFHDLEVLLPFAHNSGVSDVPVIVLTDSRDMESEVKFLELGASDYIVKPFHPSVLIRRIDNILAMHNSQRIKVLTEYDTLTGLYTKDMFCRKTKAFLAREQEQEYDIICLDIERFKVVNDLFGTEEGDKLLHYLGENLYVKIKEMGGICGRLNADNFAICMPHREECGQELVDWSIKLMEDYPIDIHVLVNFGVYRVDNLFTPITTMCDRANMAIEKIKGKYNERLAVYNENIRAEMLAEQSIVNEMSYVLERGEFVPYYQPKVNMRTKEIIGAEALVRWHRPDNHMIPPGIFIPIFEKNGFISSLDFYVWEQVCKDIRKWRQQGLEVVPVSVNVSRLELYNNKLGEILQRLIQKYDIPIKLFQLEITETAYTDNPFQLVKAVEELRSMGFTILMDDFGSGYSSLNMLKDVPVDILKIDLKFLTAGQVENHKGNNILKSVVQMTKRLELPAIAEGVETKEQEDLLLSMGCFRAQGYLYAKPMPEKEFVEKCLLSGNVTPVEQKDVVNYTIVNDIMSVLHDEEEIDWYRFILLQMKIEVLEYDFRHDTLTILNQVSEKLDKALVRLEIPNCSKHVEDFVHPDDWELAWVLLRGEKADTAKIRMKNPAEKDIRFRWYELNCRSIHNDKKDVIYVIAAARCISNEMIREQVMEILSGFDQASSSMLAVKKALQLIGREFLVDRICFMTKNQNEKTSFTKYCWVQDEFYEKVDDIGKFPTREIESITDKYNKDGILVLQKNESHVLPEQLRKEMFSEGVETIVINQVVIDQGNLGAILYQNFDVPRKWQEGELAALGEMGKCMALNCGKSLAYERMKYNEVRFEIALEQTSFRIWDYDIKTKRLFRSKSIQRSVGYDEYVENVPDTFVEEGIIHPSSIEVYTHMYQELAEGRDASAMFKCRHQDGSFKWMQISYRVLFDEKGNPVRAIGIGDDVNEIYDIKSRSEQNALFRDAIITDAALYFEVDLQSDRYLLLSDTMVGQGVTKESSYIESNEYLCRRLVVKEHQDRYRAITAREHLMKSFSEGKRMQNVQYKMRVGSEKFAWMEATFYLYYNKVLEDVCCFTCIKNVDDKKRYELALEENVKKDPLTGVYNRAAARKMIDTYLQEHGKEQSSAFFMVDLDNFKVINDTFGHCYGDEVLVTVAETLKSSVRPNDLVARIGGDEFVIFLAGADDKEYVYHQAEVILNRLFMTYATEKGKNVLSCSLGIAFSPEQGMDFETLYAKADKAQYHSKAKGKNQYSEYSIEEKGNNK